MMMDDVAQNQNSELRLCYVARQWTAPLYPCMQITHSKQLSHLLQYSIVDLTQYSSSALRVVYYFVLLRYLLMQSVLVVNAL